MRRSMEVAAARPGPAGSRPRDSSTASRQKRPEAQPVDRFLGNTRPTTAMRMTWTTGPYSPPSGKMTLTAHPQLQVLKETLQ